jgi:hypothetical protein
MSRLKVYYGDDASFPAAVAAPADPVIYNYQSYAGRIGNSLLSEPTLRARALRTNDTCPHCRRSLVEPLELDDGMRTRNNLPIPGTATLVGFHCLNCHREWPA